MTCYAGIRYTYRARDPRARFAQTARAVPLHPLTPTLVCGILASGGAYAAHVGSKLVGTRSAWTRGRLVRAAYVFRSRHYVGDPRTVVWRLRPDGWPLQRDRVPSSPCTLLGAPD